MTVAVAAPGPIIDRAYDVPLMGRLVDFVSIMGYDYHSYIWYLPVLGKCSYLIHTVLSG
jgi:Glycosyl hydrolases family 18.